MYVFKDRYGLWKQRMSYFCIKEFYLRMKQALAMKESTNSDQFDIRSRIKYLKLMIWAIMPLVVLVGLLGVPYYTNLTPYWKNPTVIPASSFLLCSFISYVMLKFQRYSWAIRLYVLGFIFAPFATALGDITADPGLLGLMVGGIIVASIFFQSRMELIISASIPILAILILFLISPQSGQANLFIPLSVVATLSALIVIFKSLNDEFENDRREKLKKMNITLLEQNRQLTKINNELDRFIYSVSHDIRAPLSSVTGLVNLYKKESKIENRDNYVDHIEHSIARLIRYTSDIEDFVRNSRTEPKPVKIRIEEFLNEIYAQLDHLYPTNEIRFEVDPNGIEEIVSDQDRLGIILRNVIGNSIKYANHASDSYIKCEITYEDSANIIRIKDNGMGIEASQMEKVFDMFHRGSEHSDGSGLGLYIARETARVLGGDIKISSKLKEFTELRIELPNLLLED